MHRVTSAIAFGLAVAIAVYMTALAYGLTSEYGATPNDGGMREAVSWTASLAIPSALVVTVLVALGTMGAPTSLRRRFVLGAAVLPALGVSLGVLLGAQR